MSKFWPTVSNKMALRLLKWSEFFYYFLVILPVIVVLYQNKGITVGDFFLIQGISALAAFVLEIPSGYLSDCFSRRKVLILGAAIYLFANGWLYAGYGFWDIAFAEMLLGFASALFSGTKESYTYDLLKRMGREKEFLKENSSLSSYCQAASFIASVIGGMLYAHIGNGILVVEAIAALIALVCVLLLPELGEVKRVRKKDTSAIADIASVVKMSVKNPAIKWFILFPAIFGAFTKILLWLFQPTMEQVGIALSLFGVFVGFNQFMRLVFSKYADAIFKRFATSTLLKFICAMIFLVFVAVVVCVNLPLGIWSYLLLVFIFLWPAIQKLCALIFSAFIHERIKSTERGTVMSVSSMAVAFFGMSAMMIMKPLLDAFGLTGAAIIAGCAFLIMLWPLKKVLDIIKEK